MAASKKVKRVVKETVEIADDLMLHIAEVTVADRRFFEIRNYIPSLKHYGRGVTVPAEQWSTFRAALDLSTRAKP